MKIHELEKEAQALREKISLISQISKKSASDLAEWRECKVQLAIIEDHIDRIRERASHLRQSSNLGERFSRRTFSNFEVNEETEFAYTVCKRYVEKRIYDSEKNSLIICGNCGTGKTHLSAAIANELIDRGIAVLFDTYGGHLSKLKDEFNSRTGGSYIRLMKSVDLLIIDDVGKEKQTEWSSAVMYEVLNDRYESMKPVIITSNFNQTELANYFGQACYSRLVEMCHALTTKGKDYRRQ